MAETPHLPEQPDKDADRRAIRGLAIKVAIFMLVPPIAAALVIWRML